MRRYLAPILLAAVLFTIGMTAYLMTDHALAMSYQARAPLLTAEPAPSEGGPPLSTRLVVVIVDGLRSDALSAMPFMNELWGRSASAVLELPSPVYASSGWATLLTGADAELLGLPLLSDGESAAPPLPRSSLPGLMAASGRPCAIVAHTSLWPLLRDAGCADNAFVSTPGADGDLEIALHAASLWQRLPELLIVHLEAPAVVGRAQGGHGEAYQAAVYAVDGVLRQILEPIIADDATVAIMASHGIADDGAIGGTEAAIARVPFFLLGPGVIPGGYGLIAAEDVAPTLAAALGLPSPPLALGLPRYDLLSGDTVWQTGRHLRTARQQASLAAPYVEAWGSDVAALARLPEAIDAAQSAFELAEVDRAWQMANATIRAARDAMADARGRHLRSHLVPRAAAGFGLWAIFVAILAVSTRRRLWTAVVSAVALGLQQALYLASLRHYSLSAISDPERFFLNVLAQATLAVLAITIASLLLRQRLHRAPELTTTLLTATAWAVALWSLPVIVGFAYTGLLNTPVVPPAGAVFWYLFGLAQLWALPAVALPAALALAAASLFRQLLRR